MINKKTWLLLPTALFPYVILFVLATVFYSSRISMFEYIMETVFNSNALNLLLVLLIYCLIATILSIACFGICIHKNTDALALAKTAMIIKIIQIPAYILIFILGILFLITLFTIPFTIALFIFDGFTLVLTSLITISSIINAVKQGVFQTKEVILIAILQYIFCADVISSIAYYFMLKKRYNN